MFFDSKIFLQKKVGTNLIIWQLKAKNFVKKIYLCNTFFRYSVLFYIKKVFFYSLTQNLFILKY